MIYRLSNGNEHRAIAQLVESAFTDSDGAEEGALVGKLARDLFEQTKQRDLFSFVAEDDGKIIAAIFFSRIDQGNEQSVFLLSPVAVHTNCQRQGIGQGLIRYGLQHLKGDEVSVVLTYGSPDYYAKVGFRQISVDAVRPPFELSQPHGWLGQSLAGEPIESLSGTCTCVEALHDPALW